MTSNSTRTTFKILVDADACPVKEIVLGVAEDMDIPVIMVSSVSHVIDCHGPCVKVVSVDNVPQAADVAIINNVNAGDIVITGDYGLASLVLSKQATPLSHRGFVFTDENIDRLLLQRHIDARIRRGGGKAKGPKALTVKDKQAFEERLRRLIDNNPVFKDI